VKHIPGLAFLLVFLAALAAVLLRWEIPGTGPGSYTPRVTPVSSLGYVLVGDNVHRPGKTNALVLFDSSSWAVVRRIRLPDSRAQSFARDPLGRIWVGLSGDFDRADNRVLVFSPGGDLIRTVKVCDIPQAGTAFAGGRAFVACMERGFGGTVSVIDLANLQVVDRITVKGAPGRPFLLTAIAAADEAVVVAAATEPPLGATVTGDAPFAQVVFLDRVTGKEINRIVLTEPAGIWQIIPFGRQFLLLNNDWHAYKAPAGSMVPRPQAEVHAGNLMLVSARAGLTEKLAIPDLPFRGAVWGDHIYVLHRAWSAPVDVRDRFVSVDALPNGTAERLYTLSPGFESRDMAVYKGRIYLTRGDYQSDDEDGLWVIDTEGHPRLVLPVPDASQVIMPAEAGPPGD